MKQVGINIDTGAQKLMDMTDAIMLDPIVQQGLNNTDTLNDTQKSDLWRLREIDGKS